MDTRKQMAAAAAGSGEAEALTLPPTLLVDHNADPAVASNRKTGDFVVRTVPVRIACSIALRCQLTRVCAQELATREGLQRMVDGGYAYMSAELASGRLDALMAAAPRR